MALQDYTYRLKAQSGDTTPHDELGVSGDISGGTITLVDRGGGDYAWQFSSGPASVAIPSKTLAPAGTLGGVTIAVTLAVTNYGATDFATLIGVGTAAPSNATDNLTAMPCLQRTSANLLRARYTNLGATSAVTANTAEKTYVVKLVTNYSGGNDKVSFFYDATFADSAAVTMSADVVDTFWVNAVGTAVLQVKDFVFWPEELSDSDCATLRDSGIRATLDVGGHEATGALSSDASTIAGTATHTGNHTSTGALASAASTIAGTASSANPVPTITTDALKNDSGTTLASTTIDKLVAIKLSDLSTVTWTNQTTNGSGVLTLTHASLTGTTDYLLVTSNTAGTARGVGKYTTSA